MNGNPAARSNMTMSKRYILVLCAFGVALSLSLAGPVFAQAEQTPENLLDEPLPTPEETPAETPAEPEAESDAPSASGETDYNEENFRRSMELRDSQLQRSPDLTTGSYSTGTGLQALDDLPEASQKHLREQLREVIVREGPWTPEAADERYPYVPSEAAREAPGLERREQTAWGELVAEYHEREAAIHANAARTRSATAAGQQAGAGERAGMHDSGHSTNEGQAEKPGDQGDRDGAQSGGEDPRQTRNQSTGEAGGAPPAAETEQGVAQNALQLLQQRRQLPASGSAQASESAFQTSAQTSAQNLAQESNGEASPIVELDSEDVIAIEDLKNVEIDVNAEEDN